MMMMMDHHHLFREHDTQTSKSVRPKKTRPSPPSSSFSAKSVVFRATLLEEASDQSIPRIDRCTRDERDHIQSASSSRFRRVGEKILKKEKKNATQNEEITRKSTRVFALKRTWTRASSRRSFWAQKPSSAKRSESKWKTSFKDACVFFLWRRSFASRRRVRFSSKSSRHTQ